MNSLAGIGEAGAPARRRFDERLSIAGRPFAALHPETLAAFLADAGICRLDCNYANIEAVGVDALAAILVAHGVQADVVSVSPGLGRIGSQASSILARESLLRAINDAVTLGAPAVQFHTDVPEGRDRAARTRAALDALEPVLDAAARNETVLLVENNFDSRREDLDGVNPARCPETLRDLFETADDERLRLTFDPCNFVLVGIDPLLAWRTLRRWVHTVHVKDCRPASGPAADGVATITDSLTGTYTPTALGDGIVPWVDLLYTLWADGFDGALVLEPSAPDGDVLGWTTAAVSWIRAQEPIA